MVIILANNLKDTYCYYIRVSTKKQNDKGNYKIQINTIKSYSERKNLTLSDEYKDVITGVSTKKPKFNELLKNLSNYRGVIVAFIDRLGRNFVEQLRVFITLYDSGKEVHVVDYGEIDQDNPDDQFKYIIDTYFSAKELSTLKKRIKGGIKKYKDKYERWGPRRKEITDWELHDRLKKQGLSDDQIARVFKMSRTTLYNRRKEKTKNNKSDNKYD